MLKLVLVPAESALEVRGSVPDTLLRTTDCCEDTKAMQESLPEKRLSPKIQNGIYTDKTCASLFHAQMSNVRFSAILEGSSPLSWRFP